MRKLWWWMVPLAVAAMVAAFLYADEPLRDHSDLAYAPRAEQHWTPAQVALRVNWEACAPPGDLFKELATRRAEARAWVTKHDGKRRAIVKELQSTPEIPFIAPERVEPISFHYLLLRLQILHVAMLEPGEVRASEFAALCRCVKNVTAVPDFVRFLYRWLFNRDIRLLMLQEATGAQQAAEVDRLIELCDTTAPDAELFEEAIRLSFAWGADWYQEEPHTFSFKPCESRNKEARVHRAAIAAIRSGRNTIDYPEPRWPWLNSEGEDWVRVRTTTPRVGPGRFSKDRNGYLATRAALAVRRYEIANGRIPPDIVTAWPEATPDQLSRITYDPVQRRAMAGEALAEF